MKLLSILSTLMNGHPDSWHEKHILSLAKLLKPKVYVELGLYQCKLFNSIIPYADELIGVDLNPEAEKFFKKSAKTKFFNMRTDHFAQEFAKNPKPIDLLFIDADHSAASVKSDFELFFPFVVDQGIILLHDWYPKDEKYTDSGYCGDWYKAIAELSRNTNEYEMVTIPVHPGLTICRKRKEHLVFNKKI